MKPQHWGVSVSVDGEQVLCIESNCLSGVIDIDRYADVVRMAADHLHSFIGKAEAPEHTEPVTGEVEVVAYRCRHDRPFGGTWQVHQRIYEWDKFDITEPLVRKSSYDALAAAKDREIAAARESEEHATDCFKEANARAEAAERQLAEARETLGWVWRTLFKAARSAGWTWPKGMSDASLKDEGGAT